MAADMVPPKMIGHPDMLGTAVSNVSGIRLGLSADNPSIMDARSISADRNGIVTYEKGRETIMK